jgi:hypothetical protein
VTKSDSDIKSDAELICNNLAPLLGSRIGDYRWSPKTAFTVCNNLEISGLKCTNVSDDYMSDGVIAYTFDSSVTKSVGDLKQQVHNFDRTILNEYYVSIIPSSSIPRDASLSKKFQLASRLSTFTDSTILDASYNSESIQNLSICRNVGLILLTSFVIKKHLMDFYSSTSELDTNEVNNKVVNIIINNIDYVKYILSNSETNELRFKKSTNFLAQQLTTLKKNMNMIKYYVLNYIE